MGRLPSTDQLRQRLHTCRPFRVGSRAVCLVHRFRATVCCQPKARYFTTNVVAEALWHIRVPTFWASCCSPKSLKAGNSSILSQWKPESVHSPARLVSIFERGFLLKLSASEAYLGWAQVRGQLFLSRKSPAHVGYIEKKPSHPISTRPSGRGASLKGETTGKEEEMNDNVQAQQSNSHVSFCENENGPALVWAERKSGRLRAQPSKNERIDTWRTK